MCGGVHGIISSNKFHQNRFRGFRATGVRKLGSPIDLACRPYGGQKTKFWAIIDIWRATVPTPFYRWGPNLAD